MATIPTGKFMSPAIEPGEALAYVVGGAEGPKMIPESEYRAAGIEPPFETLPTLDEFEAAQEAEGADEPEKLDASSGSVRYVDLWFAMKRYDNHSDAWQEFVAALDDETDGRLLSEPREVTSNKAPMAFARHWANVANGMSPDFDADGARLSKPPRYN
jgi:hypothetical protein